jgi:hypothetical protein
MILELARNQYKAMCTVQGARRGQHKFSVKLKLDEAGERAIVDMLMELHVKPQVSLSFRITYLIFEHTQVFNGLML